MTDFRALCAELLRSLENYPVQPPRDRDLCLRARAALVEQPVGPTDEEISDLISRTAPWLRHRHPDHARAVLARWGQS